MKSFTSCGPPRITGWPCSLTASEFAQKELRPQEKPIVIGKVGYRAVIDPGKGYVLEQGPKGKKDL